MTNSITIANLEKHLTIIPKFSASEHELIMTISWPTSPTRYKLYKLLVESTNSSHRFRRYVIKKITSLMKGGNKKMYWVQFLYNIKLYTNMYKYFLKLIGVEIYLRSDAAVINIYIMAILKLDLFVDIMYKVCNDDGQFTFRLPKSFYLDDSLTIYKRRWKKKLLDFYIATIGSPDTVSLKPNSIFLPKLINYTTDDIFWATMSKRENRILFLTNIWSYLGTQVNVQYLMRVLCLLNMVPPIILRDILLDINIPTYIVGKIPLQWHRYLHPYIVYCYGKGLDLKEIKFTRRKKPYRELLAVYKDSDDENRELILEEIFDILTKFLTPN